MRKRLFANMDGVGPVLFEKSRRARKLNISLTASGMVRIAVPNTVSFNDAERIISSKLTWVRRFLDKMNRLKAEHNRYLQRTHKLSRKDTIEKLTWKITDLSLKHGFTCNKVFIRNHKTQWGSCSPKNNISLNIKLAKLPEDLIDYVILHELMHTRIKSHRDDFWAKMDEVLEDPRQFDRKLKKYHPALL